MDDSSQDSQSPHPRPLRFWVSHPMGGFAGTSTRQVWGHQIMMGINMSQAGSSAIYAHFKLYLSLTELREFPCSVIQRFLVSCSLVHLLRWLSSSRSILWWWVSSGVVGGSPSTLGTFMQVYMLGLQCQCTDYLHKSAGHYCYPKARGTHQMTLIVLKSRGKDEVEVSSLVKKSRDMDTGTRKKKTRAQQNKIQDEEHDDFVIPYPVELVR